MRTNYPKNNNKLVTRMLYVTVITQENCFRYVLINDNDSANVCNLNNSH